MFYLLLQLSFAKNVQQSPITPTREVLLVQFANPDDSPSFLSQLRKSSLDLGGMAVPVLAEVMKGESYSDKKRWLATFTMGRIMGKKSLPFIAKFTRHPNWILRLAGLKTLLALKDRSSKKFYLDGLKDASLIVRLQALENIRALEINEYGKDVWEMVFHKHNYQGQKGKRRRINIIRKAIRTVGDLRYLPAQRPLIKLIQNKKYSDLIVDIDYALGKITQKKSPPQISEKLTFWSAI